MEIVAVVTRQIERDSVHHVVGQPWRVLPGKSSIKRGFRSYFDDCRIIQPDFSAPLLGRNPSLFVRAFRGTIFRMETGLHVETGSAIESQITSRAHSVEHRPDLRPAHIHFLIVRWERERQAAGDLREYSIDVLGLERPL